MRAHVLLNLLNVLGKVIKCEACRAFYYFFATSLIKLKNTGARMSDTIYNMALELFCKHVFVVKTSIICRTYLTLLRASFHNINKICY